MKFNSSSLVIAAIAAAAFPAASAKAPERSLDEAAECVADTNCPDDHVCQQTCHADGNCSSSCVCANDDACPGDAVCSRAGCNGASVAARGCFDQSQLDDECRMYYPGFFSCDAKLALAEPVGVHACSRRQPPVEMSEDPADDGGAQLAPPPDSSLLSGGSNDELDSQNEEQILQQPARYESAIIGPTWVVAEYYSAEQDGLVAPVEGSTITVEFEPDGGLDGHAGCNSYGGSVEHLGDSSFKVPGPLRSTLMLCEAPVSDQEFSYLAIFEMGTTIDWTLSDDGQSLVLRSSDGGYDLVRYELFAPLIVGTEWRATSYYDSARDEMMEPIEGTEITLNVEKDERFDGTAGCNNYVGQYDDLTATSFTVTSVVGATRMLCGDQARLNAAASVMGQEESYLALFTEGRAVDWAVQEDGSLELRDGTDGELLATYEDAGQQLLAGQEAGELPAPAEPLAEDSSSALGIRTAAVSVLVAAVAALSAQVM